VRLVSIEDVEGRSDESGFGEAGERVAIAAGDGVGSEIGRRVGKQDGRED
jgi:hypothetical protein